MLWEDVLHFIDKSTDLAVVHDEIISVLEKIAPWTSPHIETQQRTVRIPSWWQENIESLASLEYFWHCTQEISAHVM